MNTSLSTQLTPLFEVTIDANSTLLVELLPTLFSTVSGGSTLSYLSLVVINAATTDVLLTPFEVTYSASVNHINLEQSFTLLNTTSSAISAVVCLYGVYSNDQLYQPSLGYATTTSRPINTVALSTPPTISFDSNVMMYNNTYTTTKYLYNSAGTAVVTIPTSTNYGFARYQGSYPRWYIEIASLTKIDTRMKCIPSNDGGMYVAGNYSSNASIYSNGPVLTAPYQGVKEDILVTKVNTVGTAVWVGRISSAKRESFTDLDVDLNNNTYVCGFTVVTDDTLFAYSNDLTSVKLTLPVGTTNTTFSPFIVQYSSSGAIISYARIFPISYETPLWCISVCSQMNNIYCGGQTKASTLAYRSFNAVNAQFNNVNDANVLYDAIVIKLNQYGNTTGSEWLVRISTSSNFDSAYSITSDPTGNVYAIVTTTDNDVVPGGTATIYSPNSNTLSLTVDTTNRILMKFNASGVCLWAASITGPMTNGTLPNSNAGSMAISTDNSIYLSFKANSILSFYNNVTPTNYTFGSTLNRTAGVSSTTTLLFCKYSTAGIIQWVSTLTPTEDVIVINTTCPASGFIFVELIFTGQLTIRDIVPATITLGTVGSTVETTVLIKYDSAGTASVVGRITT